jgi:cytoskeletal protein CcmA (bactofilin family)
MQKLDLSLDIPGAPFVRFVRPEPDVEIDLDLDLNFDPPGLTGDRGGAPVAASARLASLPQRTQSPQPPHHFDQPSLSGDSVPLQQQVREAMALLHQPDTLEVRPAATLMGDLNCKSIRVRGELSGTLVASSVVLLEHESVLRGVVRDSETVIVAGTVAGSPNGLAIRCNGLVVLASSARVVGHIQCRSVAIYEGARLVGTIQPLTRDVPPVSA